MFVHLFVRKVVEETAQYKNCDPAPRIQKTVPRKEQFRSQEIERESPVSEKLRKLKE